MVAKGFVKYDLSGMTFGRLRVVRYVGTPPRGNAMWECVCECGNVATFPSGDIRRGNHKSCGCLLLSKIDASRFADVVTEQEAYWLGMMYTDGCLIETNRRVSLGLKASDAEHVTKFIRFLGSDTIPQISLMRGFSRAGAEDKRHPFARYTVRSERLFNNLVRQGCTTRKTWTIRPWHGPDYLLRHFWRGCLDGDGFLNDGSKQPGRGATVGYCGNEAMVRGFSAFVEKETGRPGIVNIKYSRRQPTGEDCRFAEVLWRGNQQAFRVVDLLYQCVAVSLSRKQKIADAIVANHRPPRFDWTTVTQTELLSARDRLGSWRSVAAEMDVSYDSLMGGIRVHGITFHRRRRRP